MSQVELLSPAGGFDKLKVAFLYGADAVYLGGRAFNLRAKSSNFSNQLLKEAVDYAHCRNKKVYVALNILAHDREIKVLPKFVKYLEEIRVDAVIVADLGILDIVLENSNIPVHISTQASTTNWRTVKMWQRLGAKRVVLARELSINEIKTIKDHVPEMEIEAFAHGAMCMTYSGRCNLSQYFSARDSNRGACTNSCRWKYTLMEEKRPGEHFPVYEDETGSYIYNSKDLCSIEFIDKILDAGVTTLKIEGRMKSLYYCANTTRIYREAIDSYCSKEFSYKPKWLNELSKMSHRGYTTGFYHGKLDKHSQQLDGGTYRTHKFAAYVKENSPELILEIKERFDTTKPVELISPQQENKQIVLGPVLDLKTEETIHIVQPNMQVVVKKNLNIFDILISSQSLSGFCAASSNKL